MRVAQAIESAGESAGVGPIRLISACAGQGLDVIGSLTGHARADDVRALLVEMDGHNVEVARERAAAAGLSAVEVVQGDASVTSVYRDAVPANVLLLCGIFGNIPHDDVRTTVAAASSLCAPGAVVVWTRHRRPPIGPPRSVTCSRKPASTRWRSTLPVKTGSPSARTGWSPIHSRSTTTSGCSPSSREPECSEAEAVRRRSHLASVAMSLPRGTPSIAPAAMRPTHRSASSTTSSPPPASEGLSRGVYIGCGNGRNYVPLVEAGLDLIGLDLSQAAIGQLADRLPNRRERLVVGGLADLPPGSRYPLVVGIQVFQHGRTDEAAAHIRAAQERVAPGGLLLSARERRRHRCAARSSRRGAIGRRQLHRRVPRRSEGRALHPLLLAPIARGTVRGRLRPRDAGARVGHATCIPGNRSVVAVGSDLVSIVRSGLTDRRASRGRGGDLLGRATKRRGDAVEPVRHSDQIGRTSPPCSSRGSRRYPVGDRRHRPQRHTADNGLERRFVLAVEGDLHLRGVPHG